MVSEKVRNEMLEKNRGIKAHPHTQYDCFLCLTELDSKRAPQIIYINFRLPPHFFLHSPPPPPHQPTHHYLERLEGAGQPSHRPDHLSLVRADNKHTLRRLLRVKYELQAGLDGLHGFLEDLEALLKACQMREREDKGVNGMSE